VFQNETLAKVTMQKNSNFKGKNLTSFAKLTTLSKKMMWHHAIKVAKTLQSI
jgi:hypothetical protein